MCANILGYLFYGICVGVGGHREFSEDCCVGVGGLVEFSEDCEGLEGKGPGGANGGFGAIGAELNVKTVERDGELRK